MYLRFNSLLPNLHKRMLGLLPTHHAPYPDPSSDFILHLDPTVQARYDAWSCGADACVLKLFHWIEECVCTLPPFSLSLRGSVTFLFQPYVSQGSVLCAKYYSKTKPILRHLSHKSLISVQVARSLAWNTSCRYPKNVGFVNGERGIRLLSKVRLWIGRHGVGCKVRRL